MLSPVAHNGGRKLREKFTKVSTLCYTTSAPKYFQCAVLNPVAHNGGRKLTENFHNLIPYGRQHQLPNLFETKIFSL
jgi:hypothetical protein